MKKAMSGRARGFQEGAEPCETKTTGTHTSNPCCGGLDHWGGNGNGHLNQTCAHPAVLKTPRFKAKRRRDQLRLSPSHQRPSFPNRARPCDTPAPAARRSWLRRPPSSPACWPAGPRIPESGRLISPATERALAMELRKVGNAVLDGEGGGAGRGRCPPGRAWGAPARGVGAAASGQCECADCPEVAGDSGCSRGPPTPPPHDAEHGHGALVSQRKRAAPLLLTRNNPAGRAFATALAGIALAAAA